MVEKIFQYRQIKGRIGRFFRIIPLLLICLMLMACAGQLKSQAPRVKELQVPKHWETPQSDNNQNKLLAEHKLSDIIIESDGLDALIKEALANNPGLVQTALTLREAGLVRKQRRGDRLPKVDGTSSSGKEDSGEGEASDTYSLGLSMSWEIDLWGRLADLENAAETDESAGNIDYESARNSLAGQVIRSWISLIGYKKMVAVEEKRLQSFEDNQEVILQQYKRGLGGLEDLEAARTNAASTAATLAERRQSLSEARRKLQLLLGKTATQNLNLPETLPSTRIPVAELPAKTLGQRLDLKAAYQKIVAGDFRAKAAYKALVPNFSISFDLSGQSNTSIGELLTGSAVWNLLGNITAPLFNGGKLRAQAEIAELTAEKAYWSYREVLLNAVVEVENALGRETSLAVQEKNLKTALIHAENNRRNYEQRYRQGLTDILNMLNAQQTAFSIEINLLDTQVRRLDNRIALGMALGLGI
ncbi:MAG: TolC family protein [Desulfobacterales bacterium]|nr:TolC family protein [Desulfobacterales bacterium]